MPETFSKDERLSQMKLIDRLFREGRRISLPEFRLRWLLVPVEDPVPVQVLISVPRSRFPKAHDRNLLKRRIREAYRRHKQILTTTPPIPKGRLVLAIIYASHRLLDDKETEEKIIVLLQRLRKENEKADQ